jgi:hypothetical protein
MGKINCLIKDTNVFENLKTEILAFSKELIDKKGSAKVNQVYSAMRKQGYEVDIESFGIAYGKAFELVDEIDREGYISQNEDIDEWSGIAYQNALNRAVKKDRTGEDMIGNLSPTQSAMARIADLFGGKSKDLRTKTIQKQMLDIMLKWANNVQSQRGETEKKDKKDVIKTIEEYFNFENIGIKTLSGSLNNLATLKSDILKSMNDVIFSIQNREDLSDEQKIDLENEYREFSQPFIKSINNIILSTADNQQLLNKVLSNSDLLDENNENFINKNGKISWNKVGGESGNVQFVRGAFRSLLDKGKIKDEKGNKLDLTEEQKDILEEHFAYIYKEKRDAVIANRAKAQAKKDSKEKALPQGSSGKSSPAITVDKLISEFIKSIGNFAVSKDAKGNAIAKTDWRTLKDDLRKDLANGNTKTIDSLVKQFDDKLKELYPKSTEAERKYTVDKLRQKLESTIKGRQIKKSALDKLTTLIDMQGGIAFESDTNQAVLALLNVKSLDDASMKKLQGLVKMLNTLSQSKIGSSNYVRTANMINYQIRKIISANSEKSVNAGGRVARILESWVRSASGLLLTGLKGISENVVTAFVNNLITSLRLGYVTRGSSLLSLKGTIDAFSSFSQTTIGSSSSESGRLGDVNVVNSVSTSERYNINQLVVRLKDLLSNVSKGNFKKSQIGDILEEIATLIPSISNTFTRVILSAPDSAYTNSMLGKNMQLTIYDILSKSHGKDVALKAIKGMRGYRNNQTLMAEFNKVYNETLADYEKLSGDKMTPMQKRALKNDIAETLTTMVLQDVTNNKISKQEAETIVRVAIHSASDTAQRFHGKKDLDIGGIGIASVTLSATSAMTKSINKHLAKQEKNIKEGKVNKALWNKAFGAYANIQFAQFMTGIGRFLSMGLKTSILGSLGDKGGIAMKEANEKSGGMISKLINNPTNITKIDENDLIKYFGASQQKKQLIGRAIASAITTTAFAFLLKAIMESGDDDDDDWKDSSRIFIETLMKSREGRAIVQRLLAIDMGLIVFMNNAINGSNKKEGAVQAGEYVANALTADGAESVLERINKSIGYLKESENNMEGVGKAAAPIVADKLFTPYDINIAEKWYKTAETIRQATEKKTKIADRIKKLNKEIYKDSKENGISYFADIATRKGLINTLNRWNENRKKTGDVTPFMNRLKSK